MYADDIKAEYDKEFKYADITLNTSTLPIKAHEIMFGHTTAEDSVTYKPATNQSMWGSDSVWLRRWMG